MSFCLNTKGAFLLLEDESKTKLSRCASLGGLVFVAGSLRAVPVYLQQLQQPVFSGDESSELLAGKTVRF